MIEYIKKPPSYLKTIEEYKEIQEGDKTKRNFAKQYAEKKLRSLGSVCNITQEIADDLRDTESNPLLYFILEYGARYSNGKHGEPVDAIVEPVIYKAEKLFSVKIIDMKSRELLAEVPKRRIAQNDIDKINDKKVFITHIVADEQIMKVAYYPKKLWSAKWK